MKDGRRAQFVYFLVLVLLDRNVMKSPTKLFRKIKNIFLKTFFSNNNRFARMEVTESALKSGQLELYGYLICNFAVGEGIFILRKFREEKFEFHTSFALSDPVVDHIGWRTIGLLGIKKQRFSIFVSAPWDEIPASIYGFSVKFGNVHCSIQKNDRRWYWCDDERNRTFCIYIDPEVHSWRIEYFKLNSFDIAKVANAGLSPYENGGTILFGEYTNTARDNAKAVFEWAVKRKPEVRCFYVVEKDNVDQYPVGGRVIQYGSLEHLLACTEARVCAFTHHRSYVYPYIIRMVAEERYNEAETLFLQHGITAMKRSVLKNYRKTRVGYSAVCVCSTFEKKIFVDNFGYSNEEVFITGFPRIDMLCEEVIDIVNSEIWVLVFPTWRKGIEKMSSAEASDSCFVQSWISAFNRLRTIEGLKVRLVLHPMLNRHAELFQPYVDEIGRTAQFQEFLRYSNCLITDYSSVSFDALYLNKQVFLYQFDQDEFGIRQDAFIDIDSQQPGDVIVDEAGLFAAVTKAAAEGWAFTQQAQRDMFFNHRDDNNCERVFSLIQSLAARKSNDHMARLSE